MSAVRREFINLNVNGQHLKQTPDVHCVNGGVRGSARKKTRNREAIFLFSVILVQTICMVVGFIVFAYFVDMQFEGERERRWHMSEKINCLSNEIELLKKNMTMKSNRTGQTMPRAGLMPPLHGKSEVMKVVTVETIEEYPEIEHLRDEKEYDDDSDEDDDFEEEAQTADNAEFYINGNSGSAPTNLNADISRLRDLDTQHHLDLQKSLGKQQPLAANSSARNTQSPLGPLRSQITLVQSNDDDEDEAKQTADNTEIHINANNGSAPTGLHLNTSFLQDLEARHRPVPQRNLEKQQQHAANLPTRNTWRPAESMKTHSQRRLELANADHIEQTDENPKPPVVKAKHNIPIKESQMLPRNTNREDDRGYLKPRTARSAPEKRHVNQVQDSGQPRMNSINPTAHSLAMDSMKDTSSAAINVWSWPAAHFNSNDLSSQRPNTTDDCSREIQNNMKKWAPSDVPGSEHFDLKNYEKITVRKEGLYFVYSQIYFYKDRSIFGYLIKRENQVVLQCSIHTPTNRTSNGSGTTCFTAGLVYIRANDILRLEIFNESGKCVRWGPGKSFIGLYKLPQTQDSSTFL